jgi:hypothetical protein
MNWDDCLADESSISEILHKQFSKQLRFSNNKWRYYDNINSIWVTDEDNSYIDQLFIMQSYNDILQRILFWQNNTECKEYLKNYRIVNFNNIIKVLNNKKKYKNIMRETIAQFCD